MERLSGASELLDGPLDPPVLAGNLRDLTRVNRLLGGAELSWRAFLRATEAQAGGPISLLDVGTGAADIPRHLLRRAEASPYRLVVVASDIRTEILDFARLSSAGVAGLTVQHAALDRPDFGDGSFDIVHASLVLHHHEPDDAVELLGEMARICRRAVIVNDLDRARRWWLGAWLLSRVATGNRYTRHDAPLSVRRAYRPNELVALAALAGLREVARLWARPRHRYALVLVP